MSIFDVEILVDVNSFQMEKIISGELTSIVRRQIPDAEWIRRYRYESLQPIKLFIYNNEIGVFAESDCVVSTRGVYFFGGVSSREYVKNRAKYADEARRLNEVADITGTCMTIDEFRDYVGLNSHCFFLLKDVVVYDKPLGLECFLITNSYRKYTDKADKKFKTINGWCYACRLNPEQEKE